MQTLPLYCIPEVQKVGHFAQKSVIKHKFPQSAMCLTSL